MKSADIGLVLLTLLSMPVGCLLDDTIDLLSRQLMMQQLFVEERIRSDGDSGVKQVRRATGGTRPYHSETASSPVRVAAVHDHADYIDTLGMGEVGVVLNGVDFRTRHNDYKTVMPHRTSSEYEATEEIPMPDVPPEVSEKETVADQVAEMKEWFKAWSEQDYSVRDYRQYFKPILCYLEGAWTTTVDGIQESFDSDRHALDASSWLDLQEKLRFTSYAGSKHWLENYAFLPTTIMGIGDDSVPQLAQWNYRILCHPLSRDIPTNRLRLVDDLATRMREDLTLEELEVWRSARFQLNPADTDDWEDGIKKFGLLDELMYEIPGKDNYQGDLEDDFYGDPVLTYDGQSTLNAARYHRWFSRDETDAMGIDVSPRGFSDENLFMAMTTQPEVAGLKMTSCSGVACRPIEQKWSFAIPMELVYLTPLNKWNPYNIEYKGAQDTDAAKTVVADGRNGGRSLETAFNGASSDHYYLTPQEFFSGPDTDYDPADSTVSGSAGVLDMNGELRLTRASGLRVMLPKIEGLDQTRQRYPIMPVHGEGSAVGKELEALTDIVKDLQGKLDEIGGEMKDHTHRPTNRSATMMKTAGLGLLLLVLYWAFS